MPEVEEILRERNETHGDFREQFVCAQQLKNVFLTYNYDKLSMVQKEVLDMVAHKLSRILTGNANFADHWVDLAGYSTLGAKALNGPVA